MKEGKSSLKYISKPEWGSYKLLFMMRRVFSKIKKMQNSAKCLTQIWHKGANTFFGTNERDSSRTSFQYVFKGTHGMILILKE